MLSRIANNLYWAGRYLERIEHISRFVPVSYFAALDGPESVSMQYSLRSINLMAGSTIEGGVPLVESVVLSNIAFEKTNPHSLISCAILARENCRGARDILSTELWESINRLYHFIQDYDRNVYLTTGMQAFMLQVQDKVALCKARIQTTLIQNQVWSILTLGLLLERSAQILRITESKLKEMEELPKTDNEVIEIFEIGNLMRSLESYDMNRKFYGKTVDKRNALEFLLFQKNFPRSLSYCIIHICSHLTELGIDKRGKEKSVKLLAQKFKNDLSYESVDDVLQNPIEYLSTCAQTVSSINNNLINNYFST
ncbi:Uncharacterized conserved protein, Alpha-E superfamily [Spirosomataceae bacterium TFI 002]|nr:Uncharacterized conserved protein, Alpha-E superfamily [Spirosomataceae bacterium TFI 002]